MPRLQHPASEQTVVDVPEERAEVLRDRGYNDVDSSDDSAGDGTPNVSDTKDVWVEYAQTQGYDPEEGLTKDELIDRYRG